MKLSISLADAVAVDRAGKVGALGLGVTVLGVAGLPATFHGGVLVVADPEAGDAGAHEFHLTLAGPGMVAEQQIGRGTLEFGTTEDQLVFASPLTLQIAAEGPHVIRVSCGQASATMRFVVKALEIADREGR